MDGNEAIPPGRYEVRVVDDLVQLNWYDEKGNLVFLSRSTTEEARTLARLLFAASGGFDIKSVSDNDQK